MVERRFPVAPVFSRERVVSSLYLTPLLIVPCLGRAAVFVVHGKHRLRASFAVETKNEQRS